MQKLDELLKEFAHEVQVEKGWQIIKLKVQQNKKRILEREIEELNETLISKQKYIILL